MKWWLIFSLVSVNCFALDDAPISDAQFDTVRAEINNPNIDRTLTINQGEVIEQNDYHYVPSSSINTAPQVQVNSHNLQLELLDKENQTLIKEMNADNQKIIDTHTPIFTNQVREERDMSELGEENVVFSECKKIGLTKCETIVKKKVK